MQSLVFLSVSERVCIPGSDPPGFDPPDLETACVSSGVYVYASRLICVFNEATAPDLNRV